MGDTMLLELQGEQLTLTCPSADDAVSSRGASIKSIRHSLEQGPLNAGNVEKAIYQIEDMIMPILRDLSVCTELTLIGMEYGKLASLLGAKAPTEISLDEVEYLFNQLADRAGGSAVAWQYSMAVEEIALALLLLRETMHHGGFNSVSF